MGRAAAQGSRYIVTERFGGHHIAAAAVGPGSRAAAYAAVFALAAFAAQGIIVAQLHKKRVSAVDFSKIIGADIACGQGKESTGLDFAYMGDEEYALAIAGGYHVPGGGGSGSAGSLHECTAVVVPFGGLDGERQFTTQLQQPLP